MSPIRLDLGRGVGNLKEALADEIGRNKRVYSLYSITAV